MEYEFETWILLIACAEKLSAQVKEQNPLKISP
jgi:hypothetical protein